MPRLWTLLALAALLLMPIGGAGAQAMAEPAPASAPGHCDEHQQPADVPDSMQVHCTGCAGLPVLETPAEVEPLALQAPAQAALVEAFSGVDPGTDPPPPKRS